MYACFTGFMAGCVVRSYAPAREQVEVVEAGPELESAGAVVEGPGVEVIEVEPAPVERVYIYERCFPPGVYLYGEYYYYHGYRYERNVFVNKYVTVNIQKNKYMNVRENRRVGLTIERKDKTHYATAHGGSPPSRDRSVGGSRVPKSNELRHKPHSVPDPKELDHKSKPNSVPDPKELDHKR